MLERGKPEPDALEETNRERMLALEHRALEAWRSFGPDGASPAEEDAIDETFVDRVLEALEASQPRLVLLDAQVPAPGRAWWQRPIGRFAAFAAAAGLVAAVGLQAASPDDEPEESVAVTLEAGTGELEANPSSGEDPPKSTTIPEDLDRRVEAYISAYGRNYGPAFKFHGVIVVARGGEVQYSRAFGVARRDLGDPNTADTRFRLGLLTEPFTAVAILQLEQAGMLDVDH